MKNINIFDNKTKNAIQRCVTSDEYNPKDAIRASRTCEEYSPTDAIQRCVASDEYSPTDAIQRCVASDEYMAIVYQSSAITICEENNFKSMKAVDDIKFGDLLLIEHVFSNTPAACKLVIQYNEYLFDQYHPRTTKFKDALGLEKSIVDKMAKDKLTHNCFGLEYGTYTITSTITTMNHSCDPNCAVQIREKYKSGDTVTVFMELFAIRAIKRGTELTISYGPKTSHERDFECSCGKTLENRTKQFNVVSNISIYLSKTNNDIIKEYIYKYLETDTAKKILLNHYLCNNGVFLNNGIVSAYTKTGEDLINNIVNVFMNIDKTKFNDEIKVAPINEIKTRIFMSILHNKFFDKK